MFEEERSGRLPSGFSAGAAAAGVVNNLRAEALAPGRRVPSFDSVLRRFLLYGFAGWVVEVLFTGVASALRRDRLASARTYLWMHPIYGGTALVLEQLSKRMQGTPRWTRGLAYTAVIYLAEYGSGWLLRRSTGRCPWDYAGSGRDLNGLVRFDYAPAWFALGLLFDPLRSALGALEPGETAAAEASRASEPLAARVQELRLAIPWPGPAQP